MNINKAREKFVVYI